MTSGVIVHRDVGERLASVETRLDSHDRQILNIEREIDSSLKKASDSRRHMHEKIEGLDRRINGIVIGGLIGLIGILINAIIGIFSIYLKIKIGG